MTNPTSALSPQNGFSAQLSSPMTITDTVAYLSTLPTASEGYLTVDEGLPTQEVFFFNSKGSNFVTIPSLGDRGLQGSSNGISAHSAGASVKMKVVAQYLQALASGNASTYVPTLGTAQITSTYSSITTTASDVGLSTTVTIPAGGKRIKITCRFNLNGNGSVTGGGSGVIAVILLEGSTVLDQHQSVLANNAVTFGGMFSTVFNATAGSHTYKLQAQVVAGTGTGQLIASSTLPAYILVEAI